MTAPDSAGGAIRLRLAERIAWITLNRPERLNAFGGTMRNDLVEALREAESDPATRVVVITGAGRAFSAGADVDAMTRMLRDRDEEAFRAAVEAGMRVVQTICGLRCPVLAGINGPAAGAGASLAVACDLRLASDSASIGFTFARIGLHADWGATYHLPRLVGAGRAAELFCSARMVGAEEAREIGLFERVVPAGEFPEALAAFAKELANKAPLALSAIKRSLARWPYDSLPAMLATEADAQLGCFASADAREGITAFREKRPPAFRGG